MKLVTARDRGTEYLFRVHLDEGAPPAGSNVAEYRFGKQPPDGVAAAQYLANCEREVELLCRDIVARRGEGKPLPGEGKPLPGEGKAP